MAFAIIACLFYPLCDVHFSGSNKSGSSISFIIELFVYTRFECSNDKVANVYFYEGIAQ